MRFIEKGAEPSSLADYRRNADAYYDGYPHKEDIRDSLLKEQGYLCGYCMRRIAGVRDTKIEHIVPQSTLKDNPRAALNYRIMLGVCYGNAKAAREYKYLTCDARRGNKNLKINPFDVNCIEKIKYRSNGEIYSDDSDLNEDLVEKLNLNYNGSDSYLVTNRKAVLDACINKLKKEKANGNWNRSLLERMLNLYEGKDATGKYIPYSGIAIDYLRKKLRAV